MTIEEAIKTIEESPLYNDTTWEFANKLHEAINVLEQQPKIGHCKDCKWWKDSDGVYRRGLGAESKCYINTKVVCDGLGYCYMYEPKGSEV